MSRGSAQRIVVVAAVAITSAAIWLAAAGRPASARVRVAGPVARAAVSVYQTDADCPSARICFAAAGVASHGRGWVVHSRDPSGGARAWRATRVNGVESIACPTAHACVAVGPGVIEASTDPTGPAGAWHRAVDAPAPAAALDGGDAIACPSIHLCVAIAATPGELLVSTDPTRRHSLWQSITVEPVPDPPPGTVLINAVSCASTRLCVAVDDHGDIVSSTDPADASSWAHRRDVDARRELWAVDCPSERLCVAGDANGGALTSTRPGAGRGAWTRAQLGNAGNKTIINAISCPSARSCYASDSSSFVYHTADPAGGGRSWSRGYTSGYGGISHLSCPSNHLCVAGGIGAYLMSSTDPLGGYRDFALRGL